MKMTREQINEIILEELQSSVESGEINEEQLQELLKGLKALGSAAWGGIKKGAAKVRDIYRAGEAAGKTGAQQAQPQTDTPPQTTQQQTQPSAAGQQVQQTAAQTASQPQAAAAQQTTPATAETPAAAQQPAKPAAPKVISVEKGKNSLQNQLVSKYGGQLGPQANKALALISRNIKAELAANGIQVQESQKVIHGYLLKQFRLLMEGKLEDDYQEASSEESQAQAELKRLQQSVDPRDLFNYQGSTGLGGEAGYKKDLRQAQNAIDRAREKKAELKKQIDSQAAQKPAEQPKAPEATPTAAPAEQPAAKPTQTPAPPAAAKPAAQPAPEKAKHVPKAGQVNIARVVNDGLKQALGDLNDPKNQAVLKTLSPQIINLVTKFVNYAVNTSGKQGQVKIIGMGYGKQPPPAAAKPTAKPAAKPAAPAQQPAAPAAVAESYKATYDKWQKIIKG